uniref:F-box associated beta-propeller type 1 domain-containing protein n=1 Tax=Medicago truncatula TaxID=3880 RepID=I3T5A4_MEDTR|nr:unknown [Medicago truncatula]
MASFLGMFSHTSYFLWNPSIRKFKLLPPLENQDKSAPFTIIVPYTISFGYDCFIDKYKVIAVSSKNEVFLYTLGTDYWKRIDDIPYYCTICRSGLYVSGAVNWYVHDESDSSLYLILSLDLENESYQELYPPDFEDESYSWTLGVLSDYLCVFATSDMFLNVWIMKEYGNQESWTKLCSVPDMHDHGFQASAAVYISEDDQLLLQCYEFDSGEEKLVVYDSKTGIFNILEFQNNYEHISQKVYIESLISP